MHRHEIHRAPCAVPQEVFQVAQPHRGTGAVRHGRRAQADLSGEGVHVRLVSADGGGDVHAA